ncbi:7tm 6 domain containing protein, partial [Asbolus verrucosus]
KFIDECKIICHQITWLFFGFCILSQIFFATTPLFGHGRKLPVEIWLPFDAKLKMPTYVGSYIFVTIGVGNGAGSNGVIDPLIAGLACYGATQLRILQDNLQHLDEYVNAEISNQGFSEAKNVVETKYLKDKVLYKKITHCIEHHNAIFNFIQNYENVYSSVVFTQFAASILVICLCCWQLIMSNNVTTAIYMSNWYDYDINSKKALMVLMERSQTPMIVTAGKILDLSLVTFTTILRRAYSLLAVLKNY